VNNVHSIPELCAEATAATKRADFDGARALLLQAMAQTTGREEEFVAAANQLRDGFIRAEDYRAALTVDWYAGSERTQRALLDRVPSIDRARTFIAWAERDSAAPERSHRVVQLYAQAAEEYESVGLVAHAAIARERAGDFVRACALWSRLTLLLSASEADPYAAGLAHFNLARMARRNGEPLAAREAIVRAVHLLEQAADRYETLRQRERAFDCYQVLIVIGRESGEFEHVLLGYVNAIRILCEDNLRYYAVQSYEEIVQVAEKAGELSAAATLARELAAYAQRVGLTSVANFGMLAQVRLWQAAATEATRRGAPPEVAENALLAAVISSAELGQFSTVGELYRALAELPIEAARRRHYARASARYRGVVDANVDAAPLPAQLRQAAGFPAVWHIDLIEWEQRGSASEACGDIVLELNTSTEIVRRRAMIARLTALALEDAQRSDAGRLVDASAVTSLSCSLAEQLASLELYAILAPLEHLFERPEPMVRQAVVKALARLLYKRTFITLGRALLDPVPAVVKGACQAIEELRFPHAYDSLVRIYRESSVVGVRLSALRALAKIDTLEAAELLLSVIEHEGSDERTAVIELLRRGRGTQFPELARRVLATLSKPSQAAVREVLQARGFAA
jgi:HEAT repeat protein